VVRSGMKQLELASFGPIREANIRFGDLTVLVGPQASGKSLFVQLFKAVQDAGAIRSDLKNYGFDWLRGKNVVADYCSLYFGGGLQGLVKANTTLRRDGKLVAFSSIAKPAGRMSADETVFLIPAQRVLVLQDGWPKPFMGYSAGDPYCMRRFSDSLRQLMESGLGSGGAIFPQPRRLKAELKTLVDESIYIGAKLQLEPDGMRKRIVLSQHDDDGSLPYSAWSAGQREFTPLLLGLYWLMPSAKTSRRGALRTVVIEEPEMGLHPKAIVTFGLLVLELLQRDYRVVISTHSPVVLDLVWAIGQLKGHAAAMPALKRIFGLKTITPQIKSILGAALTKDYRAYFFNRTATGVVTKDISSLDPGSPDKEVAGWGGLSGFSGEIAEIVGEALTAKSA
jgi:hypothetical protein